LEKAKQIILAPRTDYRNKYNKEHAELVLAWFTGEVTSTQVANVIFGAKAVDGKWGGRTLYYLASMLKEGIRRNEMEIKLK